MLGGMSPSQMQGMMKKMGISQTNLDVSRVIFEMPDKRLIIEDPSVVQIKMQGQESYQVSGEAREESTELFSAEDIKMVMDKTGRSEKEVRDFLEKNEGDIALAILKLKK